MSDKITIEGLEIRIEVLKDTNREHVQHIGELSAQLAQAESLSERRQEALIDYIKEVRAVRSGFEGLDDAKT